MRMRLVTEEHHVRLKPRTQICSVKVIRGMKADINEEILLFAAVWSSAPTYPTKNPCNMIYRVVDLIMLVQAFYLSLLSTVTFGDIIRNDYSNEFSKRGTVTTNYVADVSQCILFHAVVS